MQEEFVEMQCATVTARSYSRQEHNDMSIQKLI